MNLLQCSSGSRAKRSDARRQHILDVARRLFAKYGFHNTGVAQIASESGVRIGQLYRDFESKEDIVTAIVEADFIQFLAEDRLRAAVEANDIDAVDDWLAHFFDAGPNAPQDHLLLPEILAESSRNARIALSIDAIEERVEANLLSALQSLVPQADAGARRELGKLILALGVGLHQRRIIEPAETADRLAAKMRAIVRAEIQRLHG